MRGSTELNLYENLMCIHKNASHTLIDEIKEPPVIGGLLHWALYSWLESQHLLVLKVVGDLSHTNPADLIDAFCILKVRIRVEVQTRREPPTFSFGPWSEYLEVEGVVTLASSPPAESVGPPMESSNPTGLLLIIVCVPVGVVLLLTIGITIMTIFSCWYRKR